LLAFGQPNPRFGLLIELTGEILLVLNEGVLFTTRDIGVWKMIKEKVRLQKEKLARRVEKNKALTIAFLIGTGIYVVCLLLAEFREDAQDIQGVITLLYLSGLGLFCMGFFVEADEVYWKGLKEDAVEIRRAGVNYRAEIKTFHDGKNAHLIETRVSIDGVKTIVYSDPITDKAYQAAFVINGQLVSSDIDPLAARNVIRYGVLQAMSATDEKTVMVSRLRETQSYTPSSYSSEYRSSSTDRLSRLEQERRDQTDRRVVSGVVGAATNSTIVGALMGGDIVGAVIGDALNGGLDD
jgi:hypothetical protein